MVSPLTILERPVDLSPVEQARLEAWAADGYDCPLFSPDVRAGAAEKAHQRLRSVLAEGELSGLSNELPRWVKDWEERDFRPDRATADTLDERQWAALLVCNGQVTEAMLACMAREHVDMVRQASAALANRPEYTAEERTVIGAALGWRALVARDEPGYLEARAAQRVHAPYTSRRRAFAAHVRYGVHCVQRQLARIAL